ncbi:MAG TPA: serine/threonine-protein phosphatase [Methylophilaceae bacterium]|nr:serine/threonine-protein phosphatase [Methylophilaceae bacterium]HQR60347.1 serine/threonine-protein phosphatase [Methylophilaceae bacterium]
MKFTIFQASRNGPRPYNHDRVAYSYSKESLLMVLADGLGSNPHGGLAAKIAVKTLTDAFQQTARPDIANPSKFLDDQIRQVHSTIQRYAVANELYELPRTTVVAAIVQHDWLHCVHAGDSRLYHFRDGGLLYRTVDHSKVQLMHDKGEIEAEEMVAHPERNKIYSCLGGDIPPRIEIMRKRILLGGDIVLLCSDGLWAMVNDREFCDTLERENVTRSVPVLLNLAESRCSNGGDNMSAVAVNWGGHSGYPLSVSTVTMPMGLTTTIHNPVPQDASETLATTGARLSEEDIDRAISEIQAAIQKNPNKPDGL